VSLVTILFSFQGRMRRSHWWAARFATTVVAVVVLAVVFGGLSAVLPPPPSAITDTATGAAAIAVGLPALVAYVWIYLATSVKRLHDQDLTGWFTALFWIPYLGSLVAFVMLGCLDGTKGPNKYGPSDKHPEAIAETFA
jgi:uncharacterized membrane protein YhaH (DUF805 family)